MKTRIILLTLALSVCSLWAADITGVWRAQFDTQRGLQKYTFTLQQDGTKLIGNASAELNGAKRESELKEGKIEGDTVSFVEPLNIQGNDLRITYTGKVSDNEIKFTRQVGNFATTEAVAKRESATAPAQPAPAANRVRIKAGKSEPVKDAEGNVWLADQGFEGGQTIERPDIQIANTKSPDLYRAERYSMDSFSWPVPNGKYVVKLHFAETFEGITGPGQRVFSYNVQGHEFKDFDVWAKAGGPLRAYVETVNVEVPNGVIKVVFTPQVENPQINAIEISPQARAETSAVAPAPAVKTLATDITGIWKSEFDSQIGHQKYTFTFKQDGAKLTGKADSEVGDRKREAELKEGKVEGETISFVEMLSVQDNEIRITYAGKRSAEGNEIKFTREVGDFAKGEIVAKREPSAPDAKAIRIKAGRSEPVKDAEGNVWLADQGFEGGQTIERPDIQIANTKSPDLYRAERYSMDSFSWPVPNGKYVVKLHFAETFEGITGPGQRVFSFSVQGREFKDFDVWVKAGGPLRAYVETVNVEATDGKIKVAFTPKVENPQINAIEIIPQTVAGTGAAEPAPAATAPTAKTVRIKAGKSEPVKDAEGNVWLADQGFEGGQTIERPDIQIANTKSPDLYRAERYSMDSFSWRVPNGKYVVKLHFAETFEGINGPGERVFSFSVQGREFKDFDVWVKAGGPMRAYVETVNVEATNGVIKVTFTPKVENPQINAIEIIPQATAETSAGGSPTATPVLQIDAGRVTGAVSPMLYGLMTEEINFSYEGGIYAELIRDRTFKANAQNPVFWNAVGNATIALDTNQPLNAALNVSLKLDTSKASEVSRVGIANGGFWGIPVRPNTTYRASFYARGEHFSGPLTVSLESTNAEKVWASATVPRISGEWKKYEVTLATGNVETSKDNRLVISTRQPGEEGTVWFQNVSLFPPTYNHRPNGTRPDIMQLLADMQPKFLRFPGGNYLEGNAIAERFNWKETIGDVSQRPGHRSPWGYWSTDGFGLLEFLEWCEDLNMEPLLAVYAGYSLRGQRVEPGPDLEPCAQEAVQEIEYVIGDANTKWGAQRVQDGHPNPFKLTYVEIGNEDWFDRSGSYDGRFAQLYDAIKAKYPHLKVISSVGYEQRPALWVHSRAPDLVDEHYYRSQEEMQAHALDYDKYARTNGAKIFCGEWATRVGSPTPNMAGALGDAAWMTGMERNSDILLMSCYAPLFVNVSQLTGPNRSMQWSTDLIGYDALTSYGSPAYYAQVMFSTMHGDEILATDSQNIPTREWQPRAQRGGGTPPPRHIRQIFFDATHDSRSGVIYLKVVNSAGSAKQINVQINGAAKVAPGGEAVSLTASSPNDTNSLEQPQKIVPRTEKVGDLSANFTREFPPYSITVLKLGTK